MGKKIDQYYDAVEQDKALLAKQNEAIEKAEQTAKDVYNNEAQKLTGDEGYKRSLELGSEGAERASKVAQQQAQTSARNSGMSKSAAAALGAQSATNAYNNNLQSQQQFAYGTGTDQLSQANKLTDQANTTVNQTGNAVSSQQNETNALNAEKWKGVDTAIDATKTAVNTVGQIGKLFSDCRTKKYADITEALVGLKDMMSPADCFAKIHAYDFKYKPEFQSLPGVDNKEHLGIMAQELERNPATKGIVEEMNGLKVVNTDHLTTANTAVIAELARRVQDLEKTIGKRG